MNLGRLRSLFLAVAELFAVPREAIPCSEVVERPVGKESESYSKPNASRRRLRVAQ